MSDDQGAAVSTTLTITVTGSNDTPIATADTNTIDKDGILIIDASNGVLSNDIGLDSGATLTVTAVNGVTGNVGNLITLASGSIVGG